MRKEFVESLLEIMRLEGENKREDTYLITGDLGFSVFEPIRERYPNRFINAGISEQNMIGVSAGLALTGKKVFVYSIIPFLLYRPFEQVRNDICYHNLPVRLIGVGAGLAYSDAGSTHLPFEDLKVADAIPNLTVLSPSDPREVEVFMKQIQGLDKPVYMRLAKNEPNLEHGKYNAIKIGKALKLRDGNKILIVSIGILTRAAMELADMLDKDGESVEVLEIHTLKPFDYSAVISAAEGKSLILTIEDSTGALFDKVACAIIGMNSKVLKFSLPDEFVHVSGSRDYLLDKFGLTAKKMYEKVKEVIS